MNIKHLAGRHDQKKHAGSVQDVRTGFGSSEGIEKFWQQSGYIGQAIEFSQDLSDRTDNDVLVDNYSMGIRLGDNSDKALVVFPMREARVNQGEATVRNVMSIGVTKITPEDERFAKGTSWSGLSNFDDLSDSESRDLTVNYMRLEDTAAEVGCEVIESDSGSFPIQLAAGMGFKLDWLMFEPVIDSVPDAFDPKYDVVRRYSRKIDFLFDQAQEFLNDKYGLEVKKRAWPELTDGDTVSQLLDLRHPLYEDVPLFDEYLSMPHNERFENVDFDKNLL